MTKIATTAVLSLIVLVTAGCSQNQLEISDSWVRSSELSGPGGMTGMFMQINNPGSDPITLVGGSSDSGLVEIHETVMGEDGMQMQQVDSGIEISPNSVVELQPGGLHVMLMDLKEGVEAGQEISVELEFVGHPNVSVTAIAKPSKAGDEEYHSDRDGME